MLNAVIDANIGNPEALSNGFSKQLYDKFIIDKKDKLNELVSDGLQKIFGEIIGSIQATTKQYAVSNTQLQAIENSMSQRATEAQMETIVSKLKDEIKNLESTNTIFKDQLYQSTQEINELKSKLELIP